MWVRVDDTLWSNAKIASVSPAAKALYLIGLSYCGDKLTDGAIARGVIPMLLGAAGVEQEVVDEMCAACLWEPTEAGWQIHDFEHYNPSAERVREVREARTEAGRRGGLVSSFNKQNGSKPASNCLSKTEAKSNPDPDPDPVPDPVPDPKLASYLRAREDGDEARNGHNDGEIGGETWREVQKQAPKRYRDKLVALETRIAEAGHVDWLDRAAVHVAEQQPGAYWPYLLAVLSGSLESGEPPGMTAPRLPASTNGRPRDGPKDLAGRYRDKIQH